MTTIYFSIMILLSWIAVLALWTETYVLTRRYQDTSDKLLAVFDLLSKDQRDAVTSKLSKYEYSCTREDLADYCP